MTVEYRTATAADLAQLAQMRWDFRTGPEEEPPAVSRDEFMEACEAFLAQGLARGDWVYWIAVDGDQIVADEEPIVADEELIVADEEPIVADEELIVGHIFLHLFRSVPKPFQLESRYGYMTNVYIRPAYRNQGIGGELMRHVQAWAAERQVPFMIVSPSDESVPFYRRAGFTFETEFMEWFLKPG
jgi:ribosomal protein S18 acetylase RimI-like enzyme